MSPKMIIILHGNDGVGKSTLCRMMNEKHNSDGIVCFQRSCYRDGDILPFRDIFDELDIAAFNNTTLSNLDKKSFPKLTFVVHIMVISLKFPLSESS